MKHFGKNVFADAVPARRRPSAGVKASTLAARLRIAGAATRDQGRVSATSPPAG
ncbi:MAG: hypothetical protein P0Y64_09635 [Candidatus Sphingomonas colombiensis]|nr:hypothetical protein [Sphingomonas sp.]WEK45118.1 MAG: hypothetical protein P0Y64_09635 [Sphingomonas sp.]